ncbi:P-loop NTPase fold protein [uncultured Sphingomonas sp.]|uniref:KAP family P-loop NTPase fold protein n=1 Tax=uncultured Sphingomonas sp. TaxID=158754 RepID=UPI00260F247C|nr:P-loop NTPase fold protein [uncultured Sphingomonas sp.]
MARRKATLLLEGTTPVTRAGDDRYGRSRFGKTLAKIVDAQSGAGLVVIGVDGGWGTGKSSALALAVEQLTRFRRHREVFVSAWRSSTQDQFLANLSFSIATALRRDWQSASWRIALAKLRRQSLPMVLAILTPLLTIIALYLLPDVRDLTKRVVESDPTKLAAGLGLFGLPVIGYAFSKISKPFAAGFAALLGPTGTDAIGSVERFAYDFDVLGAAQPWGSRFIVLVEDLDRCTPGHVTDVLSAIAQLSAHPRANRLAFLLAYDRKVLLTSIASDAVAHLAVDGVEAGPLAEDYLNRVVQIELPLPDVDPAVPPSRIVGLPRVSTLLRGFVVSVLIVSFGLAHVAVDPVRREAALVFLTALTLMVLELGVEQIRKRHYAYRPPDDWAQAATEVETWLEGEPRRRARVRNRARVALLVNEGGRIDSWMALSVAALADSWPDGFDTATLAEAGDRPLDVKKDYHESGVTQAIDDMKAKGLSVGHFTDARKVLAIVSTFKR